MYRLDELNITYLEFDIILYQLVTKMKEGD